MGFLQPLLRHAITPSRKSKPKVQEFVYRDEMNKKQAPVKVKKKVHFDSKADESHKSYERVNKKDDRSREKSGIQVKILMTKEEAVRFLSKYKDGGILEFKDVANELVRISNNRVDVVSNKRKD